MLGLVRLLAVAALIILIVAQRFAYTIVAELPTQPGADLSKIDYVGVGAPGTEVDIICPTGIEFTAPNHVALVDVDNRRLIDIDVGARRIASAEALGLDRSIIPEATVADSGALWTWVQDNIGRLQAALPLGRGPNGEFQVQGDAFRGAAPVAENVQRRLIALGFPGSTAGPAIKSRLGPVLQRLRLRGSSDTLTSPNGTSYALNYGFPDGHALKIVVQDASGNTKTVEAFTRYDIVSVNALAAQDTGNVFVVVTSVDKSAPALAVHEAVYKINTAAAKPAVYDIPLEGGDCVARQHIAVSPEGDVYMLRVTASEVALLKIGKRSIFSYLRMPYTRFGHLDPTLGAPFSGFGGLMSAHAETLVDKPASGKMSRRDVLHNACAYLNHAWTPTAANLAINAPLCACSKTTSCQHWSAPPRLDGKASTSVTSLPYNWGGADRLTDFDQKLNMSRPAGQVCTPTKGGDVIYDSSHAVNDTLTAGVDCSGFVTRAWGFPGSAHNYTTSTMKTIADPLTGVLDLRPGDIMNEAGSHVRMMLNWRGADSIEIIESSTWGGGVDRRIMTLATLTAYKPMRARHLADDVAAVTVNDITCVP